MERLLLAKQKPERSRSCFTVSTRFADRFEKTVTFPVSSETTTATAPYRSHTERRAVPGPHPARLDRFGRDGENDPPAAIVWRINHRPVVHR